MSNSSYVNNHYVPNWISKIVCWHKDRNLIDGSTNKAQVSKLLEEFTEVYAAIYPNTPAIKLRNMLLDEVHTLFKKGKIKGVTDIDARAALMDGLGDMQVVEIGIAERSDMLVSECLEAAYVDIKDRKGQMIDGVFVKESDI